MQRKMCDIFCHGASKKEEKQVCLFPSFLLSFSHSNKFFTFIPYTFVQNDSLKIPPSFYASTQS